MQQLVYFELIWKFGPFLDHYWTISGPLLFYILPVHSILLIFLSPVLMMCYQGKMLFCDFIMEIMM